MPETITEILERDSRRVLKLVEALLDRSTLRSINDPSSEIVFVGPDRAWSDLDEEGRRLQSRLLNELERYAPLVRTMVRVAPKSVRDAVDKANATLAEIADRSTLTWHRTVDDARDAALKAVATQLDAVGGLDDLSEGVPIYVADASSVLRNPALDEWTFAETPRFTIMLTSTLLQELDDLKLTGKTESVRTKAESVVRRINDYWRRGDLHEGVTLRRDRSVIQSLAVEPDFSNTLPWLDPSINDDRYIASMIEVMRRHSRSPITLVTADANLRNKARHARIPFIETPEPPSEGGPRRPDPSAVRLLEIRSTGGGSGALDFVVMVQNRGQQPVRIHARAAVGARTVECWPDTLDLLVNEHPKPLSIKVARPELGELMPECNGEATLYGEELLVEIHDDAGRQASISWTERLYDPESEQARHEVQQRYWRAGRGEETEADRRAFALADMERRHLERLKDPPRSWSDV